MVLLGLLLLAVLLGRMLEKLATSAWWANTFVAIFALVLVIVGSIRRYREASRVYNQVRSAYLELDKRHKNEEKDPDDGVSS